MSPSAPPPKPPRQGNRKAIPQAGTTNADRLSGLYFGEVEEKTTLTTSRLETPLSGGYKSDGHSNLIYDSTPIVRDETKTEVRREGVYYYFYPDGRVGRSSAPEIRCKPHEETSDCGNYRIHGKRITFQWNSDKETSHEIVFIPNGFMLDDTTFIKERATQNTPPVPTGEPTRSAAIDGTYSTTMVEHLEAGSFFPTAEIKKTLRFTAEGIFEEVATTQITESTANGMTISAPRTEVTKGTYRLDGRAGELLYSTGRRKRARFTIPPQYMSFFPPEVIRLDEYDWKLVE
jgi:hypothetical protein